MQKAGAAVGHRRPDNRGSVLLLTLLLLSFLSTLLLLAGYERALGTRAQAALEQAVTLLYTAQAGVAHGRALCARIDLSSPDAGAPGEGEPPEGEGEDAGREGGETPEDLVPPLERRVTFNAGTYRLRIFALADEAAERPPVDVGDSGVLLIVRAEGGQGCKSLHVLLEDPPACRPVAWWEPEACGLTP